MNEESKQIALRYKGEDYNEVKADLQKRGFTHQGFNEWRSPETGCVYKFILAETGGYVTRVELMSDGQPELINTEFYDFNLAIKRFDAERAKPKQPTDSDIKQGVIHALFKFSPNYFTKELQKASRAGDAYVNMLYRSVGVEEGERISFYPNRELARRVAAISINTVNDDGTSSDSTDSGNSGGGGTDNGEGGQDFT